MFAAAALSLAFVFSGRPVVSGIPVDTTVAARVAIAHEQLRRGEDSLGRASYLDAATRVVAPADWTPFEQDLAWIASPAELLAWRTTAGKDRAAFIRNFWDGRDARDGLDPGGRLAEQVHRLDVAMERYRINPRHGKVTTMRVSSSGEAGYFGNLFGARSYLRDYIPEQGILDDRGVIYLRHGDPNVITVAGASQSESWTYDFNGRAYTVHFVHAAFDGSSGNTTLVAAAPTSAFAALCEADDLYCAAASRGFGIPPEEQQRIRAATLDAIRFLTTTDAPATGGL
jgi:hypothetical protein